jgi:arylsulfatase A-like enzyme
MDTLDQLVAEEPMREPGGQYVFVHLIMPHGPYLRDNTCRYVGPREPSPEAVDAQYECALATIDRINQTLSRLQRYDESLIIIHSDHGTPRAADCARWDGDFPYDSTVAWVNVDETPPEVVPHQQLDCSSGVLFLLKRPHARAFTTSDLPVQLIDVAPTVADFFSLEPSQEWEGTSLLSEPEELNQRPKRFFGTRTNTIKNLDYFAEFVDGGDGWRFSRRIVPAPDDYR